MHKSNVIASLRKQGARTKRTFNSVVIDLIHSHYIPGSLCQSSYIVFAGGIAATRLQYITIHKMHKI